MSFYTIDDVIDEIGDHLPELEKLTLWIGDETGSEKAWVDIAPDASGPITPDILRQHWADFTNPNPEEPYATEREAFAHRSFLSTLEACGIISWTYSPPRAEDIPAIEARRARFANLAKTIPGPAHPANRTPITLSFKLKKGD